MYQTNNQSNNQLNRTNDRTKEYRRKNDSVRAFFEDRIERDGSGDVPCTTVWKDYLEYCGEHCLTPTGRTEFLNRLDKEFNVDRGINSVQICEEHNQVMCPERVCRQSNASDRVRRYVFKDINLA